MVRNYIEQHVADAAIDKRYYENHRKLDSIASRETAHNSDVANLSIMRTSIDIESSTPSPVLLWPCPEEGLSVWCVCVYTLRVVR